jgi:hypothetical protein
MSASTDMSSVDRKIPKREASAMHLIVQRPDSVQVALRG